MPHTLKKNVSIELIKIALLIIVSGNGQKITHPVKHR